MVPEDISATTISDVQMADAPPLTKSVAFATDKIADDMLSYEAVVYPSSSLTATDDEFQQSCDQP